MKGLFAWVGFRQTGVEFVRDARVAGEDELELFPAVEFRRRRADEFSSMSLRIASVAGGLISLLGFAYAAWLVIRTLVYGVDEAGILPRSSSSCCSWAGCKPSASA